KQGLSKKLLGPYFLIIIYQDFAKGNQGIYLYYYTSLNNLYKAQRVVLLFPISLFALVFVLGSTFQTQLHSSDTSINKNSHH
ncbi:MAG: hypothetical protein ACO3SU_08200, partial [Sedimenticolaceae bacterium]